MPDEHTYPEPDEEEGYLYVREWSDERLQQEFHFLAGLFAMTAAEVAFRADHPEHRDETGDISARDVRYYELADEVNQEVTRGDAFFTPPHLVDRD